LTRCASQLVLASRSPQRAAILSALGVRFEVRPSGFAEIEAGPAQTVARENALGKARAVELGAGELVLGVDTVVELDGRLWGKPADADAARATLRSLSGKTHVVTSAIALVAGDGQARVACTATAVTFRDLDDATRDWYVATNEWHERAGGYAIQGAGCALVASIEGDWTNVVGLPVGALLALEPALLGPCNNRFGPTRFSQIDTLELQR
jgi:septum formation protein